MYLWSFYRVRNVRDQYRPRGATGARTFRLDGICQRQSTMWVGTWERTLLLVDISKWRARLAGVRAHSIPDEFQIAQPSATVESCRLSLAYPRYAGRRVHSDLPDG